MTRLVSPERRACSFVWSAVQIMRCRFLRRGLERRLFTVREENYTFSPKSLVCSALSRSGNIIAHHHTLCRVIGPDLPLALSSH